MTNHKYLIPMIVKNNWKSKFLPREKTKIKNQRDCTSFILNRKIANQNIWVMYYKNKICKITRKNHILIEISNHKTLCSRKVMKKLKISNFKMKYLKQHQCLDHSITSQETRDMIETMRQLLIKVAVKAKTQW